MAYLVAAQGAVKLMEAAHWLVEAHYEVVVTHRESDREHSPQLLEQTPREELAQHSDFLASGSATSEEHVRDLLHRCAKKCE
jgi:hypothetical protein